MGVLCSIDLTGIKPLATTLKVLLFFPELHFGYNSIRFG